MISAGLVETKTTGTVPGASGLPGTAFRMAPKSALSGMREKAGGNGPAGS
jgi:hypothetical protein